MSECERQWTTVDVKVLLRYFDTIYCKFTVLSWLNDCEDMKLVVPDQLVLFCFITTTVYICIYMHAYIYNGDDDYFVLF